MSYSERKLQVRRIEVQMNYHAAFLYWNVRGILAEKWAHGPHLGAYNDQSDRLQLTRPTEEPQNLYAIAGLKGSAYLSEAVDDDVNRRLELGSEWLSDCLDVLQPSAVNRFQTSVFFVYPMEGAALSRARTAFDELLVPDGGLTPPGDGYEVERGVSMAARRSSGEIKQFQTAIFGIFGPEQAADYFQWHPEGKEERGLGLAVTANWIHTDPSGFSDPLDWTRRLTREAVSSARQQLPGTIMAVANSA